MLQRQRGFDVPGLMASGPRYVLVPAAAEEQARELLADLQSGDSALSEDDPGTDEPHDPRFDAPDFPS